MKLSSRRKLTVALGVLCGALALFAVVQSSKGIGRGYTLLPLSNVELDASITAPLKTSNHGMEGEMVYQTIDSKSLFTENRLSAPKAPPPIVKPAETVPVVPLNAQLIGVVITPNKKVALLRSASGDQTFRLREGMPFTGDLAGWKVLHIEARKVTFESSNAAQGQSELKLDVARGGGAMPFIPGMNSTAAPFNPQPIAQPMSAMAMPQSQPNLVAPPPQGMMQPPPPPPPSADQAAREAEVQRIIEERRAQMRAEAERLNSGKN
jgi:hypothetical protein